MQKVIGSSPICSTITFMNAVGSKHSTAFLFSLQVA